MKTKMLPFGANSFHLGKTLFRKKANDFDRVIALEGVSIFLLECYLYMISEQSFETTQLLEN